MTKEKLIVCVAAAMLGTVINIFSKAAGKSNYSELINSIIGVFIIFVLLSSASNEINGISVEQHEEAIENYEKISDDMMESILAEAEENIKNIISAEMLSQFQLSALESEVYIDRETLEVKKAVIYIFTSDAFVSNYQIENYFKKNYDIDIEVLNC